MPSRREDCRLFFLLLYFCGQSFGFFKEILTVILFSCSCLFFSLFFFVLRVAASFIRAHPEKENVSVVEGFKGVLVTAAAAVAAVAPAAFAAAMGAGGRTNERTSERASSGRTLLRPGRGEDRDSPGRCWQSSSSGLIGEECRKQFRLFSCLFSFLFCLLFSALFSSVFCFLLFSSLLFSILLYSLPPPPPSFPLCACGRPGNTSPSLALWPGKSISMKSAR